jgi:fumarate reductase subunit D
MGIWYETFNNYCALVFAITLSWDYIRSGEQGCQSIEQFGSWNLFINFLYFQLPKRSRAVPFLHSLSFVGSVVSIMIYPYLFYVIDPNLPNIQYDYSSLDKEKEKLSFIYTSMTVREIIARVTIFYIVPVFCHIMELHNNREVLVWAYSSRGWRLIHTWVAFAYPLLGFIYECTFPEAGGEVEPLQQQRKDIDLHTYFLRNKMLAFIGNVIALVTLYVFILRSYGDEEVTEKVSALMATKEVATTTRPFKKQLKKKASREDAALGNSSEADAGDEAGFTSESSWFSDVDTQMTPS